MVWKIALYTTILYQGAQEKFQGSQPGHCSTIGKHHPSQHELLTRFGCKRFWRKVQISAIRLSVSLAIHKPNFVS